MRRAPHRQRSQPAERRHQPTERSRSRSPSAPPRAVIAPMPRSVRRLAQRSSSSRRHGWLRHAVHASVNEQHPRGMLDSASICAIAPPIDAPTTCAASTPASSSTAIASSAICSRLYRPNGLSLRPAPRLSKAIDAVAPRQARTAACPSRACRRRGPGSSAPPARSAHRTPRSGGGSPSARTGVRSSALRQPVDRGDAGVHAAELVEHLLHVTLRRLRPARPRPAARAACVVAEPAGPTSTRQCDRTELLIEATGNTGDGR